jgi:hypothetical protein
MPRSVWRKRKRLPTCISIALFLVIREFRSAISSFEISIKSRLYFKKGKNYQRKPAILIGPERPAGIARNFNEIVTISTTGIWLDFFKRCHKRMRNAAFKGRMTRSINDFQFGFATPFRR